MAFYLTPPGGNISLQKLAQYAETRLGFLVQVHATHGDKMKLLDLVTNIDNVADSECLIEGTLKDRVSHFLLRLACCNHGDMSSFLVDTETILFNFRFACMTKDELVKLFRSLNSILRQNSLSKFQPSLGSVESVLNVFRQIRTCCHSWSALVTKYLWGDDDDYFRVPFHTVPKLVAARRVALQGGEARVPFCLLRDVVTGLFSEILRLGLQEAKRVCVTEDERILQIFRKIKYLYRQNVDHSTVQGRQLSLSHCEVDGVVSIFPPCMAHLHNTLRHHHRLKHNDRIRYTLFLKEAGLPVHDALMFWRKEYSQLHGNRAGGCCHGNNGCCHDWKKNEGRYTYNIRHLYGLEGSRINYRGHSCATLQDAGVCPFTEYDTPHFWRTMYEDGIHRNADRMLELAKSGDYTGACKAYMKAKLKMPNSPCTHCHHGDECLADGDKTPSSEVGSVNGGHLPGGSVDYSTSGDHGTSTAAVTEYRGSSIHTGTDCCSFTNCRINKDSGSFTNPGINKICGSSNIPTVTEYCSATTNSRIEKVCDSSTIPTITKHCSATTDSTINKVITKHCSAITNSRITKDCDDCGSTHSRIIVNSESATETSHNVRFTSVHPDHGDSFANYSTTNDGGMNDGGMSIKDNGRNIDLNACTKSNKHQYANDLMYNSRVSSCSTEEYRSEVDSSEKRTTQCTCDDKNRMLWINKPVDFYVISKRFLSKSSTEIT